MIEEYENLPEPGSYISKEEMKMKKPTETLNINEIRGDFIVLILCPDFVTVF